MREIKELCRVVFKNLRGSFFVQIEAFDKNCAKDSRKIFFIISLQSILAWYKIGIKVVESGAKWKKVVDKNLFFLILSFSRYITVSVADHLYGGRCMDDGGRLRQTLRAGD